MLRQQYAHQMLEYLVKFTLRGFYRQRRFFFINVFGLSLSLAAFIVINNYVAQEESFDSYHPQADQLWRVARHYGGETPTSFANCFAAVGPHAASNLPEVNSYGRVVIADKIFSHFSLSYEPPSGQVVAFNQTDAFFADQGIVDFFLHDWVEGDPSIALSAPDQMVLSRSTAQKFFGEEKALGKTIRLNGSQTFTITGIFEDTPENTHLPLKVLCSMGSLPAEWDLENEWGWGNFHTYIRTDAVLGLEEKIHEMASAHLAPDEGLPEAFLLQPVSDIHLHSDLRHEIAANGSASAMVFLRVIAWMVLIIGWINYVNLYTARAIESSRSIVLKKVMGSDQTKILFQLLFETLTVGMLSSVLALTLSQLVAPVLEDHMGLVYSVDLFGQLRYLLVFLLGLLAVTTYPILMIARVPVRHLMHKEWHVAGGVSVRKVLVVFQFSLTTVLVIATVVVAQQRDFMVSYETGFNKEAVLVVATPATLQEDMSEQLNRLPVALQAESSVWRVGLTAHVPGYEVTRMRWIYRQGQNADEGIYPKVISADAGFFHSLGFELNAGRFFDPAHHDERSVVMNEVAVRDLGFEQTEDAIGRTIIIEGEEREIVGVMQDYHQRSLRMAFEPIVFVHTPTLYQYYTIALQGPEMADQITSIGEAYHRLYPNDHFDYFFLDSYFDQQYARDIVFGQVTSLFSSLAIFIALFGLGGLTLFSVSQRIREIGIRKVLGARWDQLVWLLNMDFLRLIALSFIISVPCAYWVMFQWLNDYAHRIELQGVHFAGPMVAILLIAFVIIGAIVSRFVRVNPADTLRSE